LAYKYEIEHLSFSTKNTQDLDFVDMQIPVDLEGCGFERAKIFLLSVRNLLNIIHRQSSRYQRHKSWLSVTSFFCIIEQLTKKR
jgi:hypothetical protein